jgi:hypothetical protein
MPSGAMAKGAIARSVKHASLGSNIIESATNEIVWLLSAAGCLLCALRFTKKSKMPAPPILYKKVKRSPIWRFHAVEFKYAFW